MLEQQVAHHLIADDILFVSGDLVCDMPPVAVAATHRRQEATATAPLCTPPAAGPSEVGPSAGGKDKTKRPELCNIIGLWVDSEHRMDSTKLKLRKKSKRLPKKLPSALVPMPSKGIQEMRINPQGSHNNSHMGSAQFARDDSSDRDMEKFVQQIVYEHLSKPSSDAERASSEVDLGINIKPIERQSLLCPHSQKLQKKIKGAMK